MSKENNLKFKNNSFPKIALLSPEYVEHTYSGQYYEESNFDIVHLTNEYDFIRFVEKNNHNIDAIITSNDNKGWNVFEKLPQFDETFRSKWLHFNDFENHGNEIFNMIMNNIVNDRYSPKISIFTSAYKTGKIIYDTHKSVVSQTFTNWEWIIVVDSNDNGTYEIAKILADNDTRIKVYSFDEKSGGNIGEAKYRAAMLCTGEWLLELDHDDMLLPQALEHIVKASEEFPECGFIYSDFIDIDADNNNIVAQYGDKYAYGYGKPYNKVLTFNGKTQMFSCNNSPDINSATVRHIVGMPNHLRCWKSNLYRHIGSHNRKMRIADDYELCVRTFLFTTFIHIAEPLYAQRFNNNNSQNENRGDIQRRVNYISRAYNELINKRFKQLHVEDKCYNQIIQYDEKNPSTMCLPCNKVYFV